MSLKQFIKLNYWKFQKQKIRVIKRVIFQSPQINLKKEK